MAAKPPPPGRLTRRRFLAGAAALGAAAAVGQPPRAGAQTVLKALVWCDHSEPALLASFEQAWGVRVAAREYATTAEAVALLEQSGPGEWDVLVLDTVDIPRLARRGLLAELSPADFPLESLFPEVRAPAFNEVEGRLYGVTEKFGYNGLAFNRSRVDMADMRRLSVMWDPAYAGRMAIVDEYNPIVSLVAMGLGLEPSRLRKRDLPEILDALVAMKKLALLIGDAGAVQNALLGGAADVVIGGGESSVAGLMAEVPGLDWSLPEQGGVRWMQSLALSSHSAQPELARRFMQHLLAPRGQALLATSGCYWAMPASRKAALAPAQKEALRWSEQPGLLLRSRPYMNLEPAMEEAVQDVWTRFLNA